MQSNDKKIYSVIDLGTNTCLLLVASVYKTSGTYNLTKLFEAQEIPRMGKDLYKTGKISIDAFQNTSEIFKKYILISKKFSADGIFAFGTSALRDAANSKEFIDFIQSETGIEIRIIPGWAEAKYGYTGATYGLDESSGYAVLDIGGGSTEISFPESGNIRSISIDIGAVRLYEKFFNGNFRAENISDAVNFIRVNLNENLKKTDLVIRDKELVGIAGTITTLSAIKNNLKVFNEDIINKDILSLNEIESILERLISMTENGRLALGVL